ncbi:MAG: hypothetical protein PHO08_05945 [Methylococcales bacterium]|nr:hypothetical protein [Methylococcales bacterium]
MESSRFRSESSLPQRLVATVDSFTGRRWLLPLICEWFEHTHERVFLLTGEPGAGKSMVAAWLAGYGPVPADSTSKTQLAYIRASIKAVHFCVWASGSTAPSACAENIANQLTRQVPGFADALAASLKDRVQIMGAVYANEINAGSSVTGVHIENLNLAALSQEDSFDLALRNPLKNLYAKGYSQPMILLIDALDETLGRTRPGGEEGINLASLLAKLDDLPDQVRVIATTRPDRRVLKYLGSARRCDLIEQAPPTVDDVRSHSFDRLAWLEGERREILATRIAAAAQGNFLYVHLVLADLATRLPILDNLESVSFPVGLTGYFRDFLNRELGADEDKWAQEFGPVLGLIAVAQRVGFTKAQLEGITGREVEQTLRKCVQYLDGELPDGPFRPFHRSFAQFLLDDTGNMDYRLDAARMHDKIINYYWNACRDDWRRCDDYGLNNLASHLFELQDLGRLHALIDEQWIQVRYERRNYAYDGFLADVDLLWRLAELKNGEPRGRLGKVPHLAEEVRCALCFASINSLVATSSADQIAKFVSQCIWTPFQGLLHARHIPNSKARYEALAGLIPHLSEPQLSEAFRHAMAAARKFENPEESFQILIGLCPQVPQTLRTEAFIHAVVAANKLTNKNRIIETGNYTHWTTIQTENRNKAFHALGEMLVALFPQLPPGSPLLEQFKAACDREDEKTRTQRLFDFLSHLPKSSPELSADTGTGNQLGDDDPKATGFTTTLLDSKQSETLVEIVLAPICIEDGCERAWTLIAFSQSSVDSSCATAIRDALQALSRTTYNDYEMGQAIAEAITRLSPYVAKKLPVEMLAIVRGIANDDGKAKALSSLAPYLPESLLDEEMVIVTSIGHGRAAEALAGFAPSMNEPFLDQAISVVGEIDGDWGRAKALCAMAPSLPVPLLLRALKIARGLGNDHARLKALIALIPRLPEALLAETASVLTPLVQEALAITRSLSDWQKQRDALTALVPYLSVDLLGETLSWVCKMDWDWAKCEILLALPPNLPSPLLRDALAIVRSLSDTGAQVSALTALAPCLPESLLAEALAFVGQLGQDKSKVAGLAVLAPRLTQALLPEVLAIARNLGTDETRAEALATVSPYLPDSLVEQALAWVGQMSQDKAKATALTALAPRIPQTLLSEALATVRSLGADETRIECLSAVLPYLPDSLVEQALAWVGQMEQDQIRAVGLVALVPKLPSLLLPEALALTRGFGVTERQVDVLTAVIPYLANDLLGETLEWIREMGRAVGWSSYSYVVRALTALAPHLPSALLPDALTVAFELEKSGSYWYCPKSLRILLFFRLSDLVPEPLRNSALTKAYEVAKEIRDSDYYELSSDIENLCTLARMLPAEEGSDIYLRLIGMAKNTSAGRNYSEWLASARVGALAKVFTYMDGALLDETLLSVAVAATLECSHDLLPGGGHTQLMSGGEYLQVNPWAILGLYFSADRLSAIYPWSVVLDYIAEPLLPKALALARTHKNEEWLFTLVPRLPLSILPEALLAAQEIGGKAILARLVARYPDIFAKLSPSDLYPAFRDTIKEMAMLDRKVFLQQLRTLYPIIEALGGQRAAGGITQAIRVVGHWWP